MSIYGPVVYMFPFHDRRTHQPGWSYGPYGTQHEHHHCFFIENVHPLTSVSGEMVLRLGLHMMSDVDNAQGWNSRGRSQIVGSVDGV